MKHISRTAVICAIGFSYVAFAASPKSTADWVYVGNDGHGDSYYSKASIKREGDFASVRTVMNAKDSKQFTGTSQSFKSFVSYFVFDCKRWMFTMQNTFTYAEDFGEGSLILGLDEQRKATAEDIKPIDKKHLLHKAALSACK